ncbi:MAG: D-alanyl-D-alanine endopeptidase [Dechloromonas sp.]|uniref:D-alanyl-D-alanine endopeptidase n=1 Tax=Candidatus Dechloromonas phosphorivorans TaxID=2899244 RepID=A0A9D7LJK0_9RHOO|nr:D-alanyl-D-alanine endopeptidase [Candidatus Dechloromonas phosphorivorans]
MKQGLKLVALVGALLGFGLGAEGHAASDAHKSAAKKTIAQSAGAKQGSSKAAAPAGKTASAARHGSTRAAAAPAKVPHTSAGRATGHKAAAYEGSRKHLRKVSMADVDPSHLALYSASALVIDQETGQALIEKQSGTVVPIASISKLMTAMVVLDAKLDMNEVIAIGDDDVDGLKGTRSRLPVGTTMTRETAMLLALMSSENRAANSLGRHYPGGLPAFVKAMNRKAQALGMQNSRFEEPTGLSSNNVSTAHDLARMVAAAARYPEIRAFSTTGDARVDLNGHIREFHNTNALVRSDNWEIGVSKTGYISEAGRCLVMQARVADKPVVIVLLDSAGKMTRVGDANRIKRWMESASVVADRRPV